MEYVVRLRVFGVCSTQDLINFPFQYHQTAQKRCWSHCKHFVEIFLRQNLFKPFTLLAIYSAWWLWEKEREWYVSTHEEALFVRNVFNLVIKEILPIEHSNENINQSFSYSSKRHFINQADKLLGFIVSFDRNTSIKLLYRTWNILPTDPVVAKKRNLKQMFLSLQHKCFGSRKLNFAKRHETQAMCQVVFGRWNKRMRNFWKRAVLMYGIWS